MTDRIRAALQRLTELDGHTLVDCTADWAEAMIEARAALAEPDGPTLQLPEQAPDEHPPSNLNRREVAAWYHGHACGWQAALVRRMCKIILGNTFGNEELESLALLVGHHPDVLNASTVPVSAPLPVAAGEVADEARYLAKELRDQADDMSPALELFGLVHRAADLLEQRHPAPVPVAERMPGPEDCDAEGRCWLYLPDMGTEPLWRLTDPSMRSRYHSHWLPATALPLPQGEVEE